MGHEMNENFQKEIGKFRKTLIIIQSSTFFNKFLIRKFRHK